MAKTTERKVVLDPVEERASKLRFSLPIEEEIELVQDIPISIGESEVLKKVLERDRTAAVSHGGLKGILSLSDDETQTLLNFLRKI